MNLQAFWHVATIGSWRTVVLEQAAMFRECGLRPKIGIVGPERECPFGEVGEVVVRHEDAARYELPTLHALWAWCRENPGGAVLYCHTKGVTRPSANRTAWRKLMEHWVVRKWEENLRLLDDADVLGCNYRAGRGRPYFGGNFWMARAGWIAKLPDPEVFSRSFRPLRRRFAAERWVLHRPGARHVSVGCAERPLGRGSVALRILKRQGL